MPAVGSASDARADLRSGAEEEKEGAAAAAAAAAAAMLMASRGRRPCAAGLRFGAALCKF